MVILLGILVALTVGLIVVAAIELLSASDRERVVRRTEQLLGHKAKAPRDDQRRLAVRSQVARLLRTMGARFVASRDNLDGLREMLGQAGYRGDSALQMYFAGRALIMAAMAIAPFVAVPLVSDSATASVLLLPYFLLPAWFAPRMWLRQRVAARQKQLQRALPDTLDLLIVCVEAGLGLNQALARVAGEIERVSPVMSGELRVFNLEMLAGTSREEAFRNLGARTGVADLRSLATMLIQADRFGTSVAQALRVQAESLRTKRRQRAEEAAAKTTIKLVFPLVLFIFPALFVIILGPAVLAAIRGSVGAG